MFDIKRQSTEYQELLSKMLEIFELKKKYATKVLMNVDSKDAYLTFDTQKDGKIEINLRGNNSFRADSVCGVMDDEINEPIEHFETRLKEFKEEFLKKKKQEEEDFTNKGFTEIDYITIKFRNYPRIKIVKSTGIVDFQQFKSIKCSWDRPIEKSTADKLLKLRKRDLVLTDGDVNFICHKISKIELLTNASSVGTHICFGMVISFKNGEKVK
jgi:hypothetical protein